MASDILTLNAGSSSLKFSLWHSGTGMDLRELFRGEVEKIGIAPRLSAWRYGGDTVIDNRFGEDGAKLTHEDLLRELFAWLPQQRRDELKAIGHRIVHGGAVFTAPVRIDDQAMQMLSKLEPLAPLHQPHNLSTIRICAVLQPHVPQVACFDTAFHQTMEPIARRLGLPRAYDAEGLRRYGFHGLSARSDRDWARSDRRGRTAKNVATACTPRAPTPSACPDGRISLALRRPSRECESCQYRAGRSSARLFEMY
jgi:acetate kinase